MVKNDQKKLTVLQIIPKLNSGGVERGTLEVGKYLSKKGHRSIVISGGGRMVKDLIKDGSEHFKWQIGNKSIFTFRYVVALAKFIITNKVDILHVRSRFPAWICFFALKIISSKIKPKFITTFHGSYSVNPYSSIMAKGDKVIVISKTIKNYVLKNYKINSKKIFLNYRGVDPIQFPYLFQPEKLWVDEWYKCYPKTKNKIILTLPARVTRWKGQKDFLKIISELTKKFPSVIGLIIGEVNKDKENFLSELKEKVIELGIENNILFIEHRSDIKNIMSISSIVFSLSLEPEAFGRTTMESLKLGVPVIGYDHGGVGEQLREIFPEGGIQKGDLTQAALLAAKWIEAPPRVPFSELFSLDKMLENTLKVYKSA
tara:strand:+ start:925 stop:2040 length:1116 start_codon:yes stop_codon:yes gene_type:complete